MGIRWAAGGCVGVLLPVVLVQCGGTASRGSEASRSSSAGGADGTSNASGSSSDGAAGRPNEIPSDVLDACLQDPTLRTGPLTEHCEFEIEAKRAGTRTDEGRAFSAEQARVLAQALNELYRIEDDELCRRLEGAASRSLHHAIDVQDLSCSVDEDCAGVSDSTACSSGCGAVSALDAIEESRATIEASICRAREQAECDPVSPYPCIGGGGEVGCIDGICGTRPDCVDDDCSVCNILGEATCGDTEGLCSQVFAWRFDEATGECTDREFIECIASGSSCQNAAGFLRDPGGQCWWSESTCGGLVKVRPDPSCGDGDPSMSGCGIR